MIVSFAGDLRRHLPLPQNTEVVLVISYDLCSQRANPVVAPSHREGAVSDGSAAIARLAAPDRLATSK